METWKYIIVINPKGKHNFDHFYYITIVEIPTPKGEHSCRYTELSLYRKEGIIQNVIYFELNSFVF